MKKYITQMAAACLAVALFVGATAQATAQEAEKKARPLPFRGTIDSVDTEAKTVTLKGAESKRVFHVSAETKMMKNGKPATLADATPGEVIGGSYTKDANGKLNAVSLRFGPKPESEKETE
jgi:hypothetical protein